MRAGGDALDLHVHDRPRPAGAVTGWRCYVGCSLLQACTVMVPYWSSVVTRVAVGTGQVVGSAQANVAPRRAGGAGRAGWWVGVNAAVGVPPSHS
jgi:hypothetical protein